jgi:methyl-accepting chemotaxis protein
MVSMIATAATEQTAASNDIAASTSDISQLAQQSSGSAKDTEQACTSLNKLAEDMRQVIGEFRIERHKGGYAIQLSNEPRKQLQPAWQSN